MRDAFAHCEALLRPADRDRFLATLFAPAEHRDARFALYALNVEITRVREAALEPLARYRLPVERFQALIAARRFDLYDEPMATLGDLEAYADGASSGLIALAAQVLLAGAQPDIGALCHHAGVAHAIAGLLKAFPVHAARGQLFVPLEVLERHRGSRQDVAGGRATPQLRAVLSELRERARHHLRAAQELL